ncbi:MAG: PKD domain-containing protein, partial [Patescibacteria group bacterium]
MLKKEEIERKKKASKLALFGGLAFLGLAVLWLGSIFYLDPRLTPEQRFTSYIITEPAEPLGLTAPVEILFDARAIPINEADYTILSYTWNFGDGSVGSGPIVTHRYTKKSPTGTYTVTLAVNLRNVKTGETAMEEFSTIVGIENEKVTASFTATPRSGELPLDVEFDASASYDPDGQIVSYEWDLDGDGQFDDAEGPIADFTYSSEGDYIVSLKVTDNNGETNIAEETISAGSVGGLRAVITAPLQSDQSYIVGEKYEFTGEASRIDEGSITKYVWDFGDDTNAVQARSTSHTFEEEGDFTITLTVHDADGNTHEITLDIEVADQGTPPTAKLETNPELLNDVVSGPVPLEVEFDATSSTDPEDDIIDYEWDFDNDGEVDDTGDTASFTYEEVDTYEARLIVTDSAGNSNEKIITVDVKEQGVIARLSATVTSGEVPLTVTFDASASTYKEGDV